MEDVVIVSAARTPIGRFGGSLAEIPAAQLGAVAVRAAVERAGVRPEDVDDVIRKDRPTIERDAEASPANVVGEDLRMIDRRHHSTSSSDRPTVSW